jgi:hypothetical protein
MAGLVAKEKVGFVGGMEGGCEVGGDMNQKAPVGAGEFFTAVARAVDGMDVEGLRRLLHYDPGDCAARPGNQSQGPGGLGAQTKCFKRDHGPELVGSGARKRLVVELDGPLAIEGFEDDAFAAFTQLRPGLDHAAIAQGIAHVSVSRAAGAMPSSRQVARMSVRSSSERAAIAGVAR